MISALLTEMTSWFPDPVVHLGSDEVNEACYLENNGIQGYFATFNATIDTLLQLFQDQVQSISRKNGKTPAFWEEVVLSQSTNVPNDTLVQSWRGSDSKLKILERGYQVIVFDVDGWYLDCGRGTFVNRNKSWCDPYKTWMTMYEYDPASNVPPSLVKNIRGGEAAMWTELVDENNVIQTVFPRASAVAEALWTGQSNRSWETAAHAMDAFRTRLTQCGIQASPIWPEYCQKGSCFWQE